ncbi:hypothetical protein C8J57DRAFT_1320956 [Mycena rebaudengoi]|nr:hypothetical protein C8J57DRAFT_1320956 [Mycena rebaudengoi]
MAAKTLSTSTLSLKFMQNAHRARNLKEVQLERAEVKDDGEWEVAQEVRDAWGPETTQSVSYEASYIPFLFASDTDAGASTSAGPSAKGRRAFKRGREVADEYQPVVPPSSDANTANDNPTPKSKSKPGAAGSISNSALSGRPRTISAGNSRGAAKKPNASAGGKTARQALFDSAGVGVDLRAQKKNNSADAALDLDSNNGAEAAGGAPAASERVPQACGRGRAGGWRGQGREARARGREDGDGAEPEPEGGKKRKKKKKKEAAAD